jgi:hypothetical protein
MLSLAKWRDLPIAQPDYVRINGFLELFIAVGGHVGGGLALGRLYFKVAKEKNPTATVYQGEYHTAHKVTSAVCKQDGSLELKTEAFALHKISASGTPPPQLDGMDLVPAPWSSTWSLHPISEAATLEGEVHTDGVGISSGTATITKTDDIQLGN